jgi:hypothetical protein
MDDAWSAGASLGQHEPDGMALMASSQAGTIIMLGSVGEQRGTRRNDQRDSGGGGDAGTGGRHMRLRLIVCSLTQVQLHM